ncbi:MAG: alkaline phosphatase family protein [Galactobacter sp.]|uniref:alkaline phosphatase family protein n=1 Tax=Galactobacter sp. TaxID=2676125 RepID=UPI0025C46954|nr:nucleotide pyrophosphatase/phosphodiesterase family protein [Galactobacter sp.]
MPSVAAALGVDGYTDVVGVPRAKKAVVVLVDGLGSTLLKRHSSYAPTLKSASATAGSKVLDTVFPSTTAAALTSLATGTSPSVHGIVGYDAFDPVRRRVVNQLGSWPKDLDPEAWQPVPTLFEQLPAHGVEVTTVSRDKFRSSALTRASLRGGRFVAAANAETRVKLTLDALRKSKRGLVYLYWDDLDKVGHSHGVNSPKWLATLEELDSCMRRLAAGVDSDTLVLVSADHGMVDVPRSARLDYASEDPALLDGVEFTAGEPRGVQLHFSPDASDAQRTATRQAWEGLHGNEAWIVTRQEALDLGWFGPAPRAGVPERIGDLIIAAHADVAFYDSRRSLPKAFDMVGQHGSLTKAERKIPLVFLARP